MRGAAKGGVRAETTGQALRQAVIGRTCITRRLRLAGKSGVTLGGVARRDRQSLWRGLFRTVRRLQGQHTVWRSGLTGWGRKACVWQRAEETAVTLGFRPLYEHVCQCTARRWWCNVLS